ncbi:hypothetical protein OH77DRAFT_1218417 [Trametes cingulata]|nr:hypothetical protein OH77DRAFT_1218417 [Trametes cingulata]
MYKHASAFGRLCLARSSSVFARSCFIESPARRSRTRRRRRTPHSNSHSSHHRRTQARCVLSVLRGAEHDQQSDIPYPPCRAVLSRALLRPSHSPRMWVPAAQRATCERMINEARSALMILPSGTSDDFREPGASCGSANLTDTRPSSARRKSTIFPATPLNATLHRARGRGECLDGSAGTPLSGARHAQNGSIARSSGSPFSLEPKQAQALRLRRCRAQAPDFRARVSIATSCAPHPRPSPQRPCCALCTHAQYANTPNSSGLSPVAGRRLGQLVIEGKARLHDEPLLPAGSVLFWPGRTRLSGSRG